MSPRILQPINRDTYIIGTVMVNSWHFQKRTSLTDVYEIWYMERAWVSTQVSELQALTPEGPATSLDSLVQFPVYWK